MSMHSLPSDPPFMFISRSGVRKVLLGTREVEVRILIHGAYNVFGLIGSECNGIGLAQQPTFTKHKVPRVKTKGQVLVRGAVAAGSGYDAPTGEQNKMFDHLMTCHSSEVVDFVRKYGIHVS
jgi:hypothetical protein